jgi:hypothetical protein
VDYVRNIDWVPHKDVIGLYNQVAVIGLDFDGMSGKEEQSAEGEQNETRRDAEIHGVIQA